MKALFLLGTLKTTASGEFSNTEVLCQLLIEKLKAEGAESEVVKLADHNIPPGTRSNMGAGDEWPEILKKIFAADIIIFATPVWWDNQSSLIQRVVERMDELNDEIVQTGKSELLNKVGGIVITGGEDGAQHIIGNLANFMAWNGLTLPPAPSLSTLGIWADTKEEVMQKYISKSYIVGMATTLARNLVSLRKALIANPIPTQEKGAQALR